VGTGSGNHLPVANNDSNYSMQQGGTLTVPATGVLGNDSDADGDPLRAILVSGPGNGTFSLDQYGGFTYTPPGTFSGDITFVYRVNDTHADGNTATVTIHV